jgi:polygalacturonase
MAEEDHLQIIDNSMMLTNLKRGQTNQSIQSIPKMMINSGTRRLLVAFLIYAGLQSALAAAVEPAYFNVRNFGAVGDGVHLDSPAINRAIAAAVAAGGGTVLVPAGTYLSGSIHLQSNLRLLIDSGATILGAPQNLNAYDFTEPWTNKPYQDGGHTYFHNSLIWGENITNVFITGNGTIDGGGSPQADHWCEPEKATNADLETVAGGIVRADEYLDQLSRHSEGRHGVSTWGAEVKNGAVRLGNKAIALKRCRNILIRDITIFHGGHFAILVTGCDNLTVDNVTLDTNRDGIDIDGCHNVVVSNCRINTPADDGLCLKSTCALGEARLTENLTVINCQLSGFAEGTLLDGTMKPDKRHYGRIKFGTESSGGFRNCTVANCTFRSCRGLALEEVDGGIMENIAINNLTMVDMPEYAIYVTTGKRNRTPGVITNSRARNILISNVIGDGLGKIGGIQIFGLPEQPLEGIRLENIRLVFHGGGTKHDAAKRPEELGAGYPDTEFIGTLPAYGIFARHVRGLELANIHLNTLTNDFRPAAMFEDIQGLEIDDFKPQLTEGIPGVVMAADVKDLTIRNSPALESHKNQ